MLFIQSLQNMRSFTAIIACFLTFSLVAQKPVEGAKSSIEGQLGYQLSSITFKGASLKYRYFLKENIAARITLGINSFDSSRTINELSDFSGKTGEINLKASNWNLGFGGEYHLKGTSRLSPYVGLDLTFGGGKLKAEGKNVTEANVFADGQSYNIENPTTSFGIGFIAGADYYFVENLFIGLELGLGWQTTTIKEGSKTVVLNNQSVNTKTNGVLKTSSWNTGSVALFRLGWRF